MEAKIPLLSIIIPTLNEEAYLPELLGSIAKQTFRDFEVIVADSPKSTDRTAEIARANGCRVVEGGRVATGRNNGALAAQGKILVFFDSDVVLPNQHFLEDTVNEFIGRGLDLSTCRIRPMEGNAYDKLFYGVYNAYTVALERVLPHVPGFCIFIKRSVHEAINGFDTDIKLAEDHEYARRGSKIGVFGFLHTQCIPVSTRRFDRDGRFMTGMKYFLSELYMLAFGPIRTDIFKYRWGHGEHQETEAEAIEHDKTLAR